jgi:hypothetical protein
MSGSCAEKIPAPINESNNAETIQRIARAILDYLSSHSITTAASIGSFVKGRRAYKVKALRNLQESGEVLRVGSGRKCDPFRYRLNSRIKARPNFVEEVIL